MVFEDTGHQTMKDSNHWRQETNINPMTATVYCLERVCWLCQGRKNPGRTQWSP